MTGKILGKNAIYLILLAVLFCVPVFVSVPYYLGILILIMLNILLAVSMWLILQTGQASLAHAGFAAIGGYMAAAMATSCHFSFWLSLPAAMLIVAAIALIIGLIALRLKSHYFLIVTAAFGEIIRVVFSMINKPFGGLIGILSLPPPDPIAIPGLKVIEFTSKTSFYYLMLIITVIVIFLINRLANSRVVPVFRAIALDEVRAEHAGIDAMKYKVLAFTLGSTIAGLTGVLYAFNARCMVPSTFTFWQGIYCLIYVSVGGGITIAGPILGATVFFLLSQLLRPVQMLEPVIYGLILMMVMMFFRGGLVGAFQKAWSFITQLFRAKQVT
jgi:branched-chain amino acid transport system permease protein